VPVDDGRVLATRRRKAEHSDTFVKMIPSWVEAVIPLGIIATMVAAMGGFQGGVHHLFHGKPKLVGADEWDRLVEKRDKLLREGIETGKSH